jgi:hypothetical protein
MHLLGLAILAFALGGSAADIAPSTGVRIAVRSTAASDAQMIAHVAANKGAFEKLVHLYQTDQRRTWQQQGGSLIPVETPQYLSLVKELRLQGLSDDSALWMPDPYREDMVERARGLNAFTAYRYHGIFFVTDRTVFSAWEPRFGQQVWKEFFFTPERALIKDGALWWPRSHHDAKLDRRAALVSTLDSYPPEWLGRSGRIAECAYRQIDVHWYLRLCKG